MPGWKNALPISGVSHATPEVVIGPVLLCL